MAALFSFLIVMFLMPRLIRFLTGRSIKQMIREDGPQTHLTKNQTPTMGGVLIVGSILVSSLLFCRLDFANVLLSLTMMVLFAWIGFMDDFLKLYKKNSKGVSFRAKMFWLGLISIVMVAWSIQMDFVDPSIYFPFLKDVSIQIGALFIIWGFLVIVGSANAVNLTDGLDGLAIVPTMTTAFVLMLTSYVSGHAIFSEYLQYQSIPGTGELSVVMASVIGAGMGFLWFNSHPAQIFMGDVGSLALGGLLGTVALLTHQEILLFIAGFLFVLEAFSVMLQVGYYKSKQKRIFRMAPLHHHFELAGWPESKVIIRFWILSVIFAIVALTTLKLR